MKTITPFLRHTPLLLLFLAICCPMHFFGCKKQSCGYCCKAFTEKTPPYGCTHPEHPLCLYETLEKVEKITDLISCPPSTLISYDCATCNKRCSLDFRARHRLYTDCVKMLGKCPHPMQCAYIMVLPPHLTKMIVAAMDEYERYDFFAELSAEQFWTILKQLPVKNWKIYKNMISVKKSEEFAKQIPPEVAFMLKKPATRILNFNKLDLKTQQAIVSTFWPELSAETANHYLETIFKGLSTGGSLGIAARASLFNLLIVNHNLETDEKLSLFSTCVLKEIAPLSAADLTPFFSSLLSSEEAYECARTACKKMKNSSECTLLLEAIWQYLTNDARDKLIAIVLKAPDESFQPPSLCALIRGLANPYPITKKLLAKTQSADEATAFLSGLWKLLNSQQQKELALFAFALPLNTLTRRSSLLRFIGRLSETIAYHCIHMLLQKPLSADQAELLFERTYSKFDEKTRYGLYELVIKNGSINPTADQLIDLISDFPMDVRYDCIKRGIQKFGSNEMRQVFLSASCLLLTRKQRIALLKNFIQEWNIPPLEICPIIAFYASVHKATATDKSSRFYDFFYELADIFDVIFAAWEKGVDRNKKLAKKIALDLWGLIPEKKQEGLFGALAPTERTALFDKCKKTDQDQYSRLQKFQTALTILDNKKGILQT